jgi:hypothetical protein
MSRNRQRRTCVVCGGQWSAVRPQRAPEVAINAAWHFLFCRMPAPPPPAVEIGQFDDAPIDKLPGDSRPLYKYIDDTSPEHSDNTSEGDDSDSEELDDDFARVEDEDWEITEKGGCSNPTLQCSLFLMSNPKTLLNNTIACDSILP